MIYPHDYFNLTDFPFAQIFNDIDKVWEVLPKIKSYIKDYANYKIFGKISHDATIEKECVFIGENSIIEPYVYIQGFTLIGKNTTVRQGAYIRGNAIIGDNCVVGHTTEIKNSIMLNGAKAAHFAYIGDSILGSNVNLGAGTKLANLKIKTKDNYVNVKIGDVIYSTGLKKFGAVLGDNVELGCNVVTSPGTLIGPNTVSYACVSLRGFYPSNSIIRHKPELEVACRKT